MYANNVAANNMSITMTPQWPVIMSLRSTSCVGIPLQCPYTALLTITGSYFTTPYANITLSNGVPLQITYYSFDTVYFRVFADLQQQVDAMLTYNITVSVDGRNATMNNAVWFTQPPPIITSTTGCYDEPPYTFNCAPNQTITINGAYFYAPIYMVMADSSRLTPTLIDSRTLQFVVPVFTSSKFYGISSSGISRFNFSLNSF